MTINTINKLNINELIFKKFARVVFNDLPDLGHWPGSGWRFGQ